MSSKLFAAAAVTASAKSVQESLSAGLCGEIKPDVPHKIEEEFKAVKARESEQQQQYSYTQQQPQFSTLEEYEFGRVYEPRSLLVRDATATAEETYFKQVKCRDAKSEFDRQIKESEAVLAQKHAVVLEAANSHVKRCKAMSGVVVQLEQEFRTFIKLVIEMKTMAAQNQHTQSIQGRSVTMVSRFDKLLAQQHAWTELMEGTGVDGGTLLTSAMNQAQQALPAQASSQNTNSKHPVEQTANALSQKYHDYLQDVEDCLALNKGQHTLNVQYEAKQIAQKSGNSNSVNYFDYTGSVNSIRIVEEFQHAAQQPQDDQHLAWRIQQNTAEAPAKVDAAGTCEVRAFGPEPAYNALLQGHSDEGLLREEEQSEVPVAQSSQSVDPQSSLSVCDTWRALVDEVREPIAYEHKMKYAKDVQDGQGLPLLFVTDRSSTCTSVGGQEQVWQQLFAEKRQAEMEETRRKVLELEELARNKNVNENVPNRVYIQAQEPEPVHVELGITVPTSDVWQQLIDTEARDKLIALHATLDALLAQTYTKHALHDFEYANLNSKQAALQKKVVELVTDKHRAEEFLLDNAVKQKVNGVYAEVRRTLRPTMTSSAEQYVEAQKLSMEIQHMQLQGHRLALALGTQARAVVSHLATVLDLENLTLKGHQEQQRELAADKNQYPQSESQVAFHQELVQQQQKKIKELQNALSTWQKRSTDISAFAHSFVVQKTDLTPGQYHDLHLTGNSAFVHLESLAKQVLRYHGEIEDLAAFQANGGDLFQQLEESVPVIQGVDLEQSGLDRLDLSAEPILHLQSDSAEFIYKFFQLRRQARTYVSTQGMNSAALNKLMQQLYDAVGVDLKVEETHPPVQRRMLTKETVQPVQNLGSSQDLVPEPVTLSESGAAAFVVVCTAASLLL